MPVGRWVMTTAVSTLLRCWPPGPERRVVVTSHSERSASSSNSAGWMIIRVHFTVSGLPLSCGPSLSKNGTAVSAHSSGLGYDDALLPKQLRSMSVLMIPGLSGTAAMPLGSSADSACVSPSMAYLVAQYGATSGEVERPQPELKLTTI